MPASEPSSAPAPEPPPEPVPADPVVETNPPVENVPEPMEEPPAESISEPAPSPVEPAPTEPVPEQTPASASASASQVPSSASVAAPVPTPRAAPEPPPDPVSPTPHSESNTGPNAKPEISLAAAEATTEEPPGLSLQEPKPVSEPLPELSLVETGARHVDPEPAPLDGVRRLAVGLTRATGGLLSSLSSHTTEVVGWVGDLVSKLARTAGWVLGAVGGEPGPRGPYVPLDIPDTTAPPPAPLPVGGTSIAGASSSCDGSNSSADAFEKLLGQFAVLAPFSSGLLQGGGRPWFSRETLRPSSAPRPPNDRPG